MYFSITFGNKNTWDDWHIISSSRPVLATPPPKTNFINIPGGDGELDMSESPAGRPTFGSRKGSLEFIVMNGYQPWIDLYTTILNYLHGKRMKLVMEDDPNNYYMGRFAVNEWKSNADNSTITIDYVIDPYKIHNITAERSL